MAALNPKKIATCGSSYNGMHSLQELPQVAIF
jgi:hypothetical protein